MGARRLIRIATAAACLACFATPAPAVAQGCVREQTVAVLDQYCSGLPSSDGRPVSIGTSRLVGPPLAQALPASTVAEIREAGPAARALLLLSAAAPIGASRTPARRRAMARAARKVEASGELEERGNPVEAVASTIASAGADAVAAAFRWGLLISTLGLAGVAWVRFRGGVKA